MTVGGYEALTEKEKPTLRLPLEGWDAKSLAQLLGLLVHAINGCRIARFHTDFADERSSRLVGDRPPGTSLSGATPRAMSRRLG